MKAVCVMEIGAEMERITPALENVQKTLLLPLWGRALASHMMNPVLTDHKAMELIGRMDYDFSPLSKNLGVFHALSLAVRAKEFDAILEDFIRRKGNACVINIGAGLDTAFSRVKNESIQWFDVDLPDVIALRKKMLPETSEMSEISKSIFDESFFADIGENDNTLFIAGGIFMYFEQPQVRRFFELLAVRFPDAEIVFDILSPIGIRYYNHKLIKAGFPNATMKWGIRNLRLLENWNTRLKIVKHFPLYANTDIQPDWPMETRVKMRLTDLFAFAEIVHVRIN